MSTVFDVRKKRGDSAANILIRWGLWRGCIAIPMPVEMKERNQKGPRIYLPDGRELVTPDVIMIWPAIGKVCFWDSKLKHACTWHRNSQQWQTGIDTYYFEQYLEVAKALQWKVYVLFFCESSKPHGYDVLENCPPVCPTGLFAEEVNVLKEKVHHTDKSFGKGGMTFWNIRDLTQDATLEEVYSATVPEPPLPEPSPPPSVVFPQF